MRVLDYDGVTAIVEIHLASGVVSRDIVQILTEKFEIMLAEITQFNVFLKRVSKRKDYHAIIAIESDSFDHVASLATSIEQKTRRVSAQVRTSIDSAINRLQ